VGRLGRREWVVKDQFGEKWRLRVVSFGEGLSAPSSEDREYRASIGRLVYGAFDSIGARRDGKVARALLEVYDRLTGESLAERVPNPLDDRLRLLRNLDGELRRTLRRAAEVGRLGIERVERAPWPFPDALDDPQPAPEPAPHVDEELAFVAFRLVDQDGQPVPRRAVHLVLADQSEQEGFVDGEGRFRLDGVAPGNCELTFPDLDLSDFSAPRVLPGHDEGEESGPVQVDPPPSGFAYTAEPADTLSSVAERYGFLHFATIWNHAGNASLRAVRNDPHILLQGDGIAVPPKNPPTLSIPTGAERTYTVFTQALRLNLQTVDATGSPMPIDSSTLQVDGADLAPTGEGGNVAIPLARDAKVVTFKATPEAIDVLTAEVGALPPLREAGGAEARLENLGYGFFGDDADLEGDDEEAEDPDVDERLELAVELFQEASGDSPMGDATDDVLNRLRARTGA